MPGNDQRADPFDPFGHWQTLRDQGMETWSKMMLDFVHSDAYASASARWLDTYLTMSQSFQRLLADSVSHTMTNAKVASTDDLARLSERLFNLELKLDDLDARADQILSLLVKLEGRREAPAPARVAEAVAEVLKEEADRPAARAKTEPEAKKEPSRTGTTAEANPVAAAPKHEASRARDGAAATKNPPKAASRATRKAPSPSPTGDRTTPTAEPKPNEKA